jgi:hypothetical protein
MSAFQNPIAIECRVNWLTVGGGDTVHGVLARLVSPPTGDNLKCSFFNYQMIYHNILLLKKIGTN